MSVSAELNTKAANQLPLYRCHKEVRAAKILGIETAFSYARLTLEEYGDIYVTEEYLKKHAPHIGGYFVVYADGYQSYSPAKAFQEGYTRI